MRSGAVRGVAHGHDMESWRWLAANQIAADGPDGGAVHGAVGQAPDLACGVCGDLGGDDPMTDGAVAAGVPERVEAQGHFDCALAAEVVGGVLGLGGHVVDFLSGGT
jgi:hypothetical protein